MNTKEKEVVFVGVDVSKDTLDVYRPDTGENIKIQNTECIATIGTVFRVGVATPAKIIFR